MIRYIDDGRRFEINGKSFLTFLRNGAVNPRLKKLIRDKHLQLPNGYVFSPSGKSIMKLDEEKITYKKLNKANAQKHGFKTARELKDFYNMIRSHNLKPITFTELKQMHDAFINFKNVSDVPEITLSNPKQRYFNVKLEKDKFRNSHQIFNITPRFPYNDYTNSSNIYAPFF